MGGISDNYADAHVRHFRIWTRAVAVAIAPDGDHYLFKIWSGRENSTKWFAPEDIKWIEGRATVTVPVKNPGPTVVKRWEFRARQAAQEAGAGAADQPAAGGDLDHGKGGS